MWIFIILLVNHLLLTFGIPNVEPFGMPRALYLNLLAPPSVSKEDIKGLNRFSLVITIEL